MSTKSQVNVKKKVVTASAIKERTMVMCGCFDLQGVLAEEGGGCGCNSRKQMSLLSSIIELLLGREHL
eukprot:scaffold37708_cov175-Skeletonema_marinoi.AAC.2